MKPVYFPIICATVTHPNYGTITKLEMKKGAHECSPFIKSYD